MKNQKLTLLLTLITLFSTGGLAHAEGDSTRGGAQVIYVNGKERLRDRVGGCDYKTGIEMRAENPEIDQVLAKLATLDWYFAAGLKWEINHLDFCITGKLVRLRANDPDSVIVYKPQKIDQVAIRFIGSWDVYVNKKLYDGLDPKTSDQTYLPIHEAMHSFIPLNAPRRNEKVRAVVQAISDVMDGKIKTTSMLHRA